MPRSSRAAPAGPFRALDIGCGAGGDQPRARRTARPDARDHRRRPVGGAGRGRAANAATAVVAEPRSFVVGDCRRRDRRRRARPFDLFFSRHGVMFFDDPRRRLRRAARAPPRPVRALVFSCFARLVAQRLACEIARGDRRAAAGRPATRPARSASPTRDRVARDPGRRRLARRAHRADRFHLSSPARATTRSPTRCRSSQRIGPAAAALRAAPPDARAALLERLRGVVERASRRGDAVDFPAAAWIWSATPDAEQESAMTIIVHHLENSPLAARAVDARGTRAALRGQALRAEQDDDARAARAASAVHPLGKSPVIEDDGRVVAETGAIVEYLVEKADGRLGAPAHRDAALRYRLCLHYAEGSLMPPLLLKLVLGRIPLLGKAAPKRIQPMIDVHLDYDRERTGAAPLVRGRRDDRRRRHDELPARSRAQPRRARTPAARRRSPGSTRSTRARRIRPRWRRAGPTPTPDAAATAVSSKLSSRRRPGRGRSARCGGSIVGELERVEPRPPTSRPPRRDRVADDVGRRSAHVEELVDRQDQQQPGLGDVEQRQRRRRSPPAERAAPPAMPFDVTISISSIVICCPSVRSMP